MLKAAQHKPGGVFVAALAAFEHGRFAARQRNQALVAGKAIDLLIQVGELIGDARVDFDHFDTVGRRVVEKLNIEDAVIETKAGHQFFRQRMHARLHLFWQTRRILKALERRGAGEHDRIDHAENRHRALLHTAFDRYLHALYNFFGDEVMYVDRKAHVVVVKLVGRQYQPLQNMFLERLEGEMLLQLGETVDLARQDRISGLDRFDEQRKRQRDMGRVRLAVVKHFKLDRGLGCHIGDQAARVILVLRGQHRRRIGAGQAHLFGQHGGEHRAELLFAADHGGEIRIAVFFLHAADETARVEPHQACVLGEFEQVKPLVEKAVARRKLRRFKFGAVPFVREQHQNGGQ